jgi:hypothetical protein
VSIVITNKDYAAFVGFAIESALAQRGVAVEVIVVDDGSTDGSHEVIDSFRARIEAIYRPNGGQGAAFNLGFARARADVVLFLDADDVLHPGTAARVVAAFDADPDLSRVQFALDVIDHSGRPTGATMPADPDRLFRGDARPRLLRHPDDLLWQPTSGNAFARRALREIMPMPEQPYRICADYYLSNLAPLYGPVAVLSGSGGGYRVHGANAHFAATERIERLRANIVRTGVTHRLLAEACRRTGTGDLPVEPDRVLSVTALANRMLSLRLDRRGHPVRDDTRRGLLALGARAAAGRHDRPLPARAAFALWFLAAAVAPLRLLPWVARPFVMIERPSRVLGEADHHEGQHRDR